MIPCNKWVEAIIFYRSSINEDVKSIGIEYCLGQPLIDFLANTAPTRYFIAANMIDTCIFGFILGVPVFGYPIPTSIFDNIFVSQIVTNFIIIF